MHQTTKRRPRGIRHGEEFASNLPRSNKHVGDGFQSASISFSSLLVLLPPLLRHSVTLVVRYRSRNQRRRKTSLRSLRDGALVDPHIISGSVGHCTRLAHSKRCHSCARAPTRAQSRTSSVRGPKQWCAPSSCATAEGGAVSLKPSASRTRCCSSWSRCATERSGP